MPKTKKPTSKPKLGLGLRFLKHLALMLLIFFIVSGLYSLGQNKSASSPKKETKISLSQLVQDASEGKIKKIIVDGNNLEITLQDGSLQKSTKESEISLSQTLTYYGLSPEQIRALGTDNKERTGAQFWLSLLAPLLAPFIIIAVLIWLMARGAQKSNFQALSFGRTLARLIKPEKDKDGRKKGVSFDDVAGLKEPKEELQEIIQFLKSPKKFTDLGAKIPKGVLLVGPPGCGKTLIARAVANEAEVPFFSMSGSEFVEMFVGVGASRVRSTFQEAKKHAPAILFIDELDAIGRYRGAGLGGGHDEREQTLNQILAEMDGFEVNAGVIIMAATNRPDILDPALLRPGRFDRRILFDLPSFKERTEILAIHARNKPLEKSVSLENISERTPGFSGADLANLINEAAILTARRNREKISMHELRESIEKVMLGPERRSFVISKKEKKITAYHEAGHALVSSSLAGADPVQKITIIPRGQAGGYTLKTSRKDKFLRSFKEFKAELAALLGGYAAEEIVFGDITTGAANDLAQATALARKLVTEYGMSRLGPVQYKQNEEMIFLGKEIATHKHYSEKKAEEIDDEVSRFIRTAHKKARCLLFQKREVLDIITRKLIEKEVIEKEEFNEIMRGKRITPIKPDL